MKTSRPLSRCLLAICALLLVQAAGALQTSFDIDLPAGPLGSTLIDIAQRSGTLISFDPALVEGRTAPAVRGHLSTHQALELALKGSGLAAQVLASGAVTVSPLAASDTSLPRQLEAPLPPVTALAAASSDEAGLKPDTATSATRTPTPLSTLPQAVSVVTRDTMELQQATTDIESLQYVPGAVVQYGNSSFDMIPTVLVRGFPALYSLSGMRTLREGIPLDTAVIERLEVLKGPSGVIGGTAAMDGRGGTIDAQLKQAGPGQKTQVATGASSRDGATLHSSVDTGGALSETAHWRMVVHGMRSGRTDGGYQPRHTQGLLGSVRHHDGPLQIGLTLLLDRRRDVPAPASKTLNDEFTGAVVGVKPGVQRPVTDTDRGLTQADSLTLDTAWALTDHWTARLRTRFETLDQDYRRHDYSPYSDNLAWTMLYMERRASTFAAAQAELSGHLRLGSVDHRLLLAMDTHRWKSKIDAGFAYWGALDTTEFERGRTPLPEPPDLGDVRAMFPAASGRARRHGMLLQDVVTWQGLTARLAVRRDWGPERLSAEARFDDHASTQWDVGLSYQATPVMALYAGMQSAQEQAFVTHGKRLHDGRPIPRPGLRQMQAGLKFDLLEDELALRIEAYRLQQFDLVTQSSDLPGDGFFSHAGRDTRGLEIELLGRWTPRLDAGLGLNFSRSRDIETGLDRPAHHLARTASAAAPPRSLSFVSRYRLPESIAERSSVGLNVRAFSSMWVASPHSEGLIHTYRLPGGARVDTSWTSHHGPWQFSVYVLNLFDRHLYGVHSHRIYTPVDPGRTLGVALTWQK
jgi:outer membrane receptor protein involved in Fe transport